MKYLKIILALVIVGGAGYLAWSYLGPNKETPEEALSAAFLVEEERFSAFENGEIEKTPEVQSLLDEGGNLVRNFSALTEERVTRLKEINDTLQEKFTSIENEEQTLIAYNEQIKRLDTLTQTDRAKLTDENKTKVENLLQEAQSVVNNRMAVTEAKVVQLTELLDQVETLLT